MQKSNNHFEADQPAAGLAPPSAALGKSVAHFARPFGPDLLARTDRLFQWVESRRMANVWPYVRSLDTAPTASAAITYETGQAGSGINLASQDYLGLSSHPAVHAAAIDAVGRFGVHSAGSAVLLGNTSISLQLEQAIAETIGRAHV